MVEVKTNKTINMHNEIMVDGVIAVSQNAVIQSNDPNNLSIGDFIHNHDLYKANRVEIRSQMADFEDAAYLTQEELLVNMTTKEAEEE